MDFLDPKKHRQNQFRLLLGYVLIGLAIAISTVILKYVADGYSVDKNGQVTLNGVVYISSTPTSASIYLNGKPYKDTTDTRLVLPSGTYDLKVTAQGYRDWQRQIVVLGKDVQRFDYPFLIPRTLQPKPLAPAQTTPAFTTQSPDHRWLLVKPANEAALITQYDLKKPAQPVATTLTIPETIFTTGEEQTWSATEWSSDNHRLVLEHKYTLNGTATHEYILFDRADPLKSINLTRQLQLTETDTLSLFDKKYDHYYVFDQAAHTLHTATLDTTAAAQRLNNVLAFKSYGDDMLLYVTTIPPTGKAIAGKVSVVLQEGQKTYTLRTLPADAPAYPLDLATYNGDWYVLTGASTDVGVYIYQNPQQQVTASKGLPAPWRLLRLANANYVSFSSNAQFMMAESGQQFVVYDADNVRTYRFTSTEPLDAPQNHANWMDAHRLTYVSGGKQVVFDYDYQNVQQLVTALPGFAPAFSGDYKFLYTTAPVPDDAAAAVIMSTPLRVSS